jgi:hypothetical protein
LNFRTTLVLLVLVAALLVTLRFVGDAPSPVSVEPPRLIERLGAGNVTRIEIDSARREMMALEWRSGGFWLTAPFVDRADGSVVNALIEILEGNPLIEVEAEPDAAMLAELELEPPLARIGLFRGEGDTGLRMRIGSRDPTGSACHLVIEGDPKVYRTGSNLLNLLERTRREWRDGTFVRGDAALVRRFTLERPGRETIVAEREGGIDWRLVEPISFAAGPATLGSLVNGLLLLRIEAFAATAPSDDQRAEFGVAAGATRAVLDFGDRTLELRFGVTTESGARLATDSERGHVFAVTGDALSLLDRDAKSFRDPRLLQVALSRTTSLAMEGPRGVVFRIVHRPADRRFHFEEPFDRPCESGFSGELRTFAVALSGLEAASFLDAEELPSKESGIDPLAALGLVDPAWRIVVESRDSAGIEERAVIEVGDEDGAGNRAVRRTDRYPDTIYLVPIPDLERVLAVDPRIFLAREIVPATLAEFERVTLRRGNDARTIERRGQKGDASWFDAEDPERDTLEFQAWLYQFAKIEAQRFLGRDALAEDGLDPPYAVVDVEFTGGVAGKAMRFSIGDLDASGTYARLTTDRLPPRTVCEVPAFVREGVAKLLPD